MSTKITVVHHSADFDGLFCREIARKFLPKDTEFIGWDFKDVPLDATKMSQNLYIMDLPMDKPFGLDFVNATEVSKANVRDAVGLAYRDVIWIDHHKSAIESHPADIPGYRIDGVAACRLAWQWFAVWCKWCDPIPDHDFPLAEKQAYLDRKVVEPEAVRLAGEYDIWDKR